MDEDFDFFEDLDENASLKDREQNKTVSEAYRNAKRTWNLDEVNAGVEVVATAISSTRSQIEVWRQAPSLRKVWQTEEWLARAIHAHNRYCRMFHDLSYHRDLVAKRELLILSMRHEITKARALIVVSKCESARVDDRKGRFIKLIRSLGVLERQDEPALWREVDTMEPTAHQKTLEKQINSAKAKIKSVKKKMLKLKGKAGEAGDADE